MSSVFLWFYRLPIPGAVLLMLLAAAVFLLLARKLRDIPGWKAATVLLLLAWMAVILYGTLGRRVEGGNPAQPILAPLASYRAALSGGSLEIYRTNFMNAALFCPAGLLAREILPRNRKPGWKLLAVVLIFGAVSAGIEYAQYRLAIGLAETDDVIHNALGALLGALLPDLAGRIRLRFGPR